MNTLNALFTYLDAENIFIDKEEFDFQFNSHPDYPSLLAMGDTLRFFNITNGAFKISNEDIELLPDRFIVRLKNDHSDWLSFIEKEQDTYIYTDLTDEKHRVDLSGLNNLWGNVVFLVEKDESDPTESEPFKASSKLLWILSSFLFFTLFFFSSESIWFGLFVVFPLTGIYLSIAALKDLFKTKNTLVDKFCNTNPSASCSSVVKSDKWSIFKTISFSDLSIVFFSVQLVALFLLAMSKLHADYIAIQSVLLFASLPVLVASIYFQKYIEKKWCPICLAIGAVVLLELVYTLAFFGTFQLDITLQGMLLFLFVASIVVLSWSMLKKFLKERNELKASELKSNRFKRKYEIFKNMLLSSKHHVLPKSLIQFGNTEALIHIGIVTSPYCGHCKAAHYMLQTLLEKYDEKLKLSIFYNIPPNNIQLEQFALSMTHLISKGGSKAYFEAMDFWYETKNDALWQNAYGANDNYTEAIFNEHHQWFIKHDINFTPCLFVNGYKYPNAYDLTDLPFFIEELLDDHSKYIEQEQLIIAEFEKL